MSQTDEFQNLAHNEKRGERIWTSAIYVPGDFSPQACFWMPYLFFQANFSLDNSDSLKKDADELKIKSEQLQETLLETEKLAQSSVSKINNIVIELNEGSGR